MTETAAQQAAKRSMDAVREKDKQAWLNNFAEDARVEDPVGVSPLDPTGAGHRGKEAIGDFWDLMIAPGKIEFDIRESWPAGDRAVANVGSIFNTMPEGTRIEAKGVFVYHVDEEGKVAHLRAYWDYDTTMKSAGMPGS
jgi:ketosteroid isomerase-like protein